MVGSPAAFEDSGVGTYTQRRKAHIDGQFSNSTTCKNTGEYNTIKAHGLVMDETAANTTRHQCQEHYGNSPLHHAHATLTCYNSRGIG